MVIGATGGLLASGRASISGNLVDRASNTTLGADSQSAGSFDPAGLFVSGSLSGNGLLTVASAVEFGSAAEFGGTLAIVDSLTLDSGALPAAVVHFVPGAYAATLDLRGVRAGVIVTGGNVDLDRLPWQS